MVMDRYMTVAVPIYLPMSATVRVTYLTSVVYAEVMGRSTNADVIYSLQTSVIVMEKCWTVAAYVAVKDLYTNVAA